MEKAKTAVQKPDSGNGQSGAPRPIDVLRQRRGGMTEEMKAFYKEQTRVKKAIRDTLRQGPKTIPDVALAAGLPTETVTWHLMAMRKYGDVIETMTSGDYYIYRLKEAK